MHLLILYTLYFILYTSYFLFTYFHLAALAVKGETEAFAVRSYQIIRFPVRGLSLLMRRTPAHAITQAMFAEHKYGFGHGLFLVSRFYGSYPVSLIKAAGGSIHHITQIGQGRAQSPGRNYGKDGCAV